MSFLEYQIRSEAVCLGERIKKGTYRPTVMTIPYSQITGALRTLFGRQNIHAAGCITNYLQKSYLTFSPKDNVTGTSKLPITTEVLINMEGKVFVVKNEDTADFPNNFSLMIGALKTRGLGAAQLKKIREIEIIDKGKFLKRGFLNTRIPLEHLDKFKIIFDEKRMTPVYGYLFKPTSIYTGYYVLSLFEGSEVCGPEFLLRS
ncbi:MAG: hypothetical protein QW674_08610 [Candidatus Bathyarchaeia archaeon]